MKMVQLMAKMVQETRQAKNDPWASYVAIPQFLTSWQRKQLQIDVFPIPIRMRLFSSDEVAILYDIHPRTVRTWAKKGWIKPYRPTRNVTYYKGNELLSVNRFISIVAQ